MRRPLLAVAAVLAVSACSGSQPSPPTAALRQELTGLGLSDTSAATVECTLASAAASATELQNLLTSPPKYRSFKTSDRLAEAYVRCAGTDPVLQVLESGITSPAPSCAELVTTTVAANILSAALIADPVRTVLHSGPYLRCAQRLELTKSLSGRIYLATSLTGLSPVVPKDVAVCAAAVVEDAGSSTAVDDLLGGAADEDAAASLASALVKCADPALLAKLLSVTAASDLVCTQELITRTTQEATEVIVSYVLQEKERGESALRAIRDLCPVNLAG